jgi:hypothetical protein
MNVFNKLLLLLLSCASGGLNAATAITVPYGSPEDQKPPTMTLAYEHPSAKATMIVILGGEGRVGIHEKTKDTKTQSALMVKLLSEDGFSAKPINVIIFDSPLHLNPVSLRYSNEHLDRIRSAIMFYQSKYRLPIILFGHSNGSLSVTEYLNKNIQSPGISALVLSASKSDIVIKQPLSLPVMFLHHVDDQCRLTPFYAANRNFEKLKSVNTHFTGLGVVKGGDASGDPCRDGRHMFLGAYEEAAHLLSEFINNHVIR